MILWLAEQFRHEYSWMNLFSYLTFRAIMAALTSLALSLLLGPWFIRHLQGRQIGQQVRNDGPQTHLSKQGTPTMGGAMIVSVIVLSTLLWADLRNFYVWLVLYVLIGFAVIGWLDDYLKISRGNSAGLPGRWKYLLQSLVGLSAVLLLYFYGHDSFRNELVMPFVQDTHWSLGWWMIPLGYFVIVGASNAVNLTDGLDGLAIMPTVMIAAALGLFAYLAGHAVFSQYLYIAKVPGAGELAVFCAAMVGAGLGFLWFNTYPAQVFMGDVGALALGAALGIGALIVRQELVFFIMAGVFVMETVSVILQVASFKLRGKRIFRMAPIHHHFELKGWAEPKVIVRFWIISLVLVLVGLATLKIR